VFSGAISSAPGGSKNVSLRPNVWVLLRKYFSVSLKGALHPLSALYNETSSEDAGNNSA
jgi:hypothetical protein